MKQASVFTLICIFYFAIAASSQQIGDPHLKRSLTYYLDSLPASNIKYFFFDANDIADINIVKRDPAKTSADKIYIRSKHPNGFYWMSLGELQKQYAKTSPLTIFMINNEILRDDVAMYKIDSSYILKVEVIKSSEIQTLKNQVPTLTFVNIITKTKENVARSIKPAGIRIRGAETTQL